MSLESKRLEAKIERSAREALSLSQRAGITRRSWKSCSQQSNRRWLTLKPSRGSSRRLPGRLRTRKRAPPWRRAAPRHPRPPPAGISPGRGPSWASITFRLANITLLNDKALDYIASLSEEPEKPQVLVLLEAHLRGAALNKVRRQIKALGWKTFVTPAVLTQEAWGISLEPTEGAVRHEARSKFHNSGGEIVLCSPELSVWGHHQPVGAQGFRSIVYRAAG